MQKHPPPQTLLKPEQAAQLLSVSLRTLENWRHKGTGPCFIRISSRCIRYRVADIEIWQQDRINQNTAY